MSSSSRACVLMGHICFGTFNDGRRFVAIVVRLVVIVVVRAVVDDVAADASVVVGDLIVVVVDSSVSDDFSGKIV